MIITLTKANFSANNIGMLSNLVVLTNLSAGLTYSGAKTLNKGEAYNAIVTALENYKINTDTVVVTMGGVALTSGVTITNSQISINITEVTGTIAISATAEYHLLNCGLELILGYANGNNVVDNELQNRVRTPYLYGSYKIKVNDGYRIRMVVTELSDENDVVGIIYSNTSTTLTEITVNNPKAYSIITFAAADASQTISPTDEIIATFEAIESKSYVLGDTLTTTLAQGYVLANGAVNNNAAAHRVKTAVIQGPFHIETNDGFVIRGVSTSTAPDGFTGGKDILGNAALTSYDCKDECLGYSVVTFADATDNTAAISPDSNIIKTLQAYIVEIDE